MLRCLRELPAAAIRPPPPSPSRSRSVRNTQRVIEFDVAVFAGRAVAASEYHHYFVCSRKRCLIFFFFSFSFSPLKTSLLQKAAATTVHNTSLFIITRERRVNSRVNSKNTHAFFFKKQKHIRYYFSVSTVGSGSP